MSRRRRRRSGGRKPSAKTVAVLSLFFAVYVIAGEWFVHHSRKWLDQYERNFPFVASVLEFVGNPAADITDGLGITGHDCVYEYDTAAPAGEVLFAGAPVRVSSPAPDDIVILDRGDFKVGWSPKLKHPAWVAYHVLRDAKYPVGKRPSKFSTDFQVPSSPAHEDYTNSGYDRGHMAPNYAIVTRYGEWAQRRTFLMTNIAPQTAELNRGVWRNLEHRIVDYWTQKYGEIWVIVGGLSPEGEMRLIPGTQIDIPVSYYMLIVAQEGLDVRAMAVLVPQNVDYYAYAARYLLSIDDLEELTGLDFLPDLPEFISSPMEAELPSRLWPVRIGDVLNQFFLKYSKAF